MKSWGFFLLITTILADVSIKDRYIHIKIDNQGLVKLQDHVKYIYKDKKLINWKKTIFSEGSEIKDLKITINKPNKLLNVSVNNIPLNSSNTTHKLKSLEENKAFLNEIKFIAELSNNESTFIVTYEYTQSNFFLVSPEKKGFFLNFDKYEDSRTPPYEIEIKLDVSNGALFGTDSPAQFILENEDNYKWKSQREKKEFHVFIHFLKKTNKGIKGSFLMSNFDRNDKFSYSHSHNDFWDFKEWYYHHRHTNRNFGNESRGHMMLDMGFAFILLFCIFGCIFYPIVCTGMNNIEYPEESNQFHLKKEFVI